MKNGNDLKWLKLCCFYDEGGNRWMESDCGMDLHFGYGCKWKDSEADSGFPMSRRRCKVWIGHLCTGYYYSSSGGREFIMVLLLVRDVVLVTVSQVLKSSESFLYLSIVDMNVF